MAYKYQELAEVLRAQMRAGRLSAGQRMPSIRLLSQLHAVSITTAIKAYEMLEAEGYLRVEPQSGFYARARAEGLSAPTLPSFPQRVTSVDNVSLMHEVELSANQPERIAFGTAQLAAQLLPLAALQRSLIRMTRRYPAALATYARARGEPALCDALCRHFAQDGIHVQSQDLLISNGCMAALSLALQVVSQVGDSIAVPSPSYSGQLQLLASLGRKVIEIPSSADGFDLDALEQCMASGHSRACLISANFQNPLGYCLKPEDKQRLAAMAARYQCPIVEDDVFGECAYAAERPLPLKSWDQAGYVLWCGSFSKTLAPGFRVGWCAAGRYHEALSALQRAQCMAVNTPLQLTLADFVHSGEYRRHLKRLRLALASQVDLMFRAIGHYFPSNCGVTRPQGGYVLWLQLPDHCDGTDLYQAARLQGINIVPGAVFSTRDLYRHAVRLNAGNPWSATLEQALRQLSALIIESGAEF